MWTESPNFCWRFDPFWVHKWPVGTEVQSHFCTFVGVNSNLKKISYKNFTTHHSPSFPISPEQHTTSHSPNDNPFGIVRLTGISLNNCQGTFVCGVLQLMVQGFAECECLGQYSPINSDDLFGLVQLIAILATL